MKISIGSDHRGFKLKSYIIEHFKDIYWFDVGTYSTEKTDYPIYANLVCNDLLSTKADLGVLICGSGIGMSIAANRNPKIYAALCWNSNVATQAKQDDCANILVLPADFVSNPQAIKIVSVWLTTEFKGELYQKRLAMIDK